MQIIHSAGIWGYEKAGEDPTTHSERKVHKLFSNN